MASNWTLPLLQAELDQLPLGCDFILAQEDVERLFGTAGEMAGQIANFAVGHGCRASVRRGELLFQKRVRTIPHGATADFPPVDCFPSLCRAPGVSEDDYPGPDAH